MKNWQKLIQIIDGIPCTNTVNGPRSLQGRFVSFMYHDNKLDKTRFTHCLIKQVSGDKLQLEEVYHPIGRDPKRWNTTLDGPWEFESIVLPKREEPKPKPVSSGIRCIKTRECLHPESFAKITLQCVQDSGHFGACHYNKPELI